MEEFLNYINKKNYKKIQSFNLENQSKHSIQSLKEETESSDISFSELTDEKNKKNIFYFKDCNASENCDKWLGPLNGIDNIGCGINILRFLNLIEDPEAEIMLNEAKKELIGTPFPVIVLWFNTNYKKKYLFVEKKIDIKIKDDLIQFYNFIKEFMSDNTCMILKSNETIHSGHYFLLSKKNNELIRYEPLYSEKNNCFKKIITDISDKYFNLFKDVYKSISLLYIVYNDKIHTSSSHSSSVDPLLSNLSGGNKDNIFNKFINSINNSIECNIPLKSIGKTKKYISKISKSKISKSKISKSKISKSKISKSKISKSKISKSKINKSKINKSKINKSKIKPKNIKLKYIKYNNN